MSRPLTVLPPRSKFNRPAPYRYALNDLITPEELDSNSATPWGPVSFYDCALLEPFSKVPDGICSVVSPLMFGGCADCQLRSHAKNFPRQLKIKQIDCRAGTTATLVALRLRGELIGFMLGPELPKPHVRESEWINYLPRQQRPRVQGLIEQPPDGKTFRRFLLDKSKVVEQICGERHRLKVVDDGLRGMSAAKSPEDVYDNLYRAALAARV